MSQINSIDVVDPKLVESLRSELHQWGKDTLGNAPDKQRLALAIAMEQEASAIRQDCAEGTTIAIVKVELPLHIGARSRVENVIVDVASLFGNATLVGLSDCDRSRTLLFRVKTHYAEGMKTALQALPFVNIPLE